MSMVVYLGNQITPLVELEGTRKSDIQLMKSMPNKEWDMTWTYHQALMILISVALLASGLVGDTKLVQNEHDREEDDFGEDMEVDWLIYTISDDDDNELVV